MEGFTTNIARSFIITGRLRDQGVRRLKNNNRHVMEISWPEGLERRGDGWKLSVRIRLVHAQIRRLLRQSPDWDAERWGEPISAAHLAFAASAFSARFLKHSRRIGVPFSKEESASFMMIWLYSAHLMGIPEAILPRSEAEALKLYDAARLCEPYPDFESIIMANALVLQSHFRQAAFVVALFGSGLVASSSPRPIQDQIRRLSFRPYETGNQPAHLRHGYGNQLFIETVVAPFFPCSSA